MSQDHAPDDKPRAKPLSERSVAELLELVGANNGQPSNAAAWNDLRALEPDWKPSFESADLRGRCFAGFNLTGANLRECDVRDTSFEGADLTGAQLDGAYAFVHSGVSAVFRSANVTDATFCGTRLERADFCDVHGKADFTGAHLMNVTAARARLAGSRFDGADLSNVLMHGESDLTGCTFVGAAMSDARLFGARLDGADFTDAVVRRIQLMDASLKSAKLVNAVADVAQLRDAKLEAADLTGASLRAADLVRTDLSRAILRDVDATNANLTGIVVTATTDFSGLIDDDTKLDKPVRDLIAMRKAASVPA